MLVGSIMSLSGDFSIRFLEPFPYCFSLRKILYFSYQNKNVLEVGVGRILVNKLYLSLPIGTDYQYSATQVVKLAPYGFYELFLN